MNDKRWWLIAIIAMIVINVGLWLWLGPRGGFGLFLFLPFMFGWRVKPGSKDPGHPNWKDSHDPDLWKPIE